MPPAPTTDETGAPGTGEHAATPAAVPVAAGRRTRSRTRRWVRRAAGAGLALVLGATLAVVAANAWVTRAADGLAFDEVAEVPERPVAIVFGAGVVDGRPTPALADRVRAAADLYREGRVGHLLMSGDNSRPDYDEVTAMRDLAIAEGVPATAITRDHAGFDTRSTCHRARDVFGVRAAVLVTQDYHLPRALYACRDLGIDAVGLRVPDWQHHPERLTWCCYPEGDARAYLAREWLARVDALVEAHVTHPEPQFLGPFVGLPGR